MKKLATVLITITLILGLFSTVALGASAGTTTRTATLKSNYEFPAKITVKYYWGTRTYGTTSTKIFTGCTGISSYVDASSWFTMSDWKQTSSSYSILDGGRTLYVTVTGVTTGYYINPATHESSPPIRETEILRYYFYKP